MTSPTTRIPEADEDENSETEALTPIVNIHKTRSTGGFRIVATYYLGLERRSTIVV